MIISRRIAGQMGEGLAADFLMKKGYRILERNFRTKLGEIDIVAKDKDTICFIEVKSRTDFSFGSPLESITAFKRKKLSQVALSYLKQHNLFEAEARFDVVTIEDHAEGKPCIHLFQNAFELTSRYGY